MGHTVIEINGKKYDAATGGIVTHTPRNIDGINKSPTQNLAPMQQKSAQPHTRPTRLVHDITTTKRHKQQKAQTLMRHVVKKPGSPLPHKAPASKHHTPQHTISNASYIAALHSDTRLHRALATPTHPTVSRFEKAAPKRVEPTLQHMPVAHAPVHSHSQSVVPTTAAPLYKQPLSSAFVDSQLAKAGSEEPSFKKTKQRKSKGKLLTLSASLASVLLIAGFIVYQNLPAVSLALAGRNAGMSMNLPKGIPSNFRMTDEISSAPGLITLSYVSQSDDREFTITQQRITEGTQESLEKAISTSTQGDYQTYQTNGLKLFIVDAGKADWMDGNMRYSVSGDSGLSSEQLAIIAASL